MHKGFAEEHNTDAVDSLPSVAVDDLIIQVGCTTLFTAL